MAGLVFAWLVQCGYLIVLTVNSSDASDGSLTEQSKSSIWEKFIFHSLNGGNQY